MARVGEPLEVLLHGRTSVRRARRTVPGSGVPLGSHHRARAGRGAGDHEHLRRVREVVVQRRRGRRPDRYASACAASTPVASSGEHDPQVSTRRVTPRSCLRHTGEPTRFVVISSPVTTPRSLPRAARRSTSQNLVRSPALNRRASRRRCRSRRARSPCLRLLHHLADEEAEQPSLPPRYASTWPGIRGEDARPRSARAPTCPTPPPARDRARRRTPARRACAIASSNALRGIRSRAATSFASSAGDTAAGSTPAPTSVFATTFAAATGVGPRRDGLLPERVEAAGDEHRRPVEVERRTRCGWIRSAGGSGSSPRSRSTSSAERLDRDEVRLGEVAIVVRLLLRPPRRERACRRVEVVRLLLEPRRPTPRRRSDARPRRRCPRAM